MLPFARNLTFAPYTGGENEDEEVEELAKAHNAETHAEAHQSWWKRIKNPLSWRKEMHKREKEEGRVPSVLVGKYEKVKS